MSKIFDKMKNIIRLVKKKNVRFALLYYILTVMLYNETCLLLFEHRR